MKFLLTTILLVSFVGVALFGYTGMHTGMQNHDGDCIAAIARGTDCPKQGNLANYINFHLNIFKGFSAATFNDIASLLLILSLLAAAVIFWILRESLSPPNLAHSRLKELDLFHLFSKHEFIRWLSLHENSPTQI